MATPQEYNAYIRQKLIANENWALLNAIKFLRERRVDSTGDVETKVREIFNSRRRELSINERDQDILAEKRIGTNK